MIQVVLAVALPRLNKGVEFRFKKIKYSLNSCRFKTSLLQIQKGLLVFLTIYCFVLSLIIPGIILSAPFRALVQIPVDSELYRNHFIHPDSLNLKRPENPRNLIVIMLESMETNFENHTPEIVSLQNANTNFIPGGVSVSGTS